MPTEKNATFLPRQFKLDRQRVNSLAWQLYKLSNIFMQIYVIGAALPVGSVSIQDLERIDGYYSQVATIKDKASMFVCLLFCSDSVRFGLATYETPKRWYNKVRHENTGHL
jgi:hypothetical protein